MTGTCQTCELHAESTFTVEGMDCREEVAMIVSRSSPENITVNLDIPEAREA